MPIIKVDVPICSSEKKEEIIRRLTKSSHDLLNIPAEKIIVIVNEHAESSWGRAGTTVSNKEFPTLSRLNKI